MAATRDQAVHAITRATPAMSEDSLRPFAFPAVGGAFDSGRLTSDGGVMLLAAAEEAPHGPAKICEGHEPSPLKFRDQEAPITHPFSCSGSLSNAMSRFCSTVHLRR